jgi:hypothetical protein
MAISVDATTGGTSTNSYISKSEASTYFKGHVLSSAWLNSSDKYTALVHASVMLDSMYNWVGDVATTTQSMQWPRILESGDYADVIPKDLRNAVCELSLYLVETGSTVVDDSLDSVGVGPIKLKFNNDRPVDLLPDLVTAMLSNLGTAKSQKGESITLSTLVRV